MNGSVMFISINPIGKLPRQKKNTAQKLVANGAVLGITVEAENDLRHGGCKERIRERGIEREGDTDGIQGIHIWHWDQKVCYYILKSSLHQH